MPIPAEGLQNEFCLLLVASGFILGIMFLGFLCPFAELRPEMLKDIPHGVRKVMGTWPLGGEKMPDFLSGQLSWRIMVVKGFHLGVFFLWSFFLFRALESVGLRPVWLAGTSAFLLSVFLGFLMEAVQATTGTRNGALIDFGFNALGSIFGLATFCICLRWIGSAE